VRPSCKPMVLRRNLRGSALVCMAMVRCLAILSALLLVLPAAAVADSARFAPVDVPATDLSDATGAVAMSAAAGHVVFSRADGNGVYRLVQWSAGAGPRVLPAGTRTAPFDADAGLDRQGRPVVTFSTCPAGATTAPGGRCALRVLRLDRSDARPRTLRLHGDRGLSLTRPSMRGRAVVAVAAPAGRSHNVRILYWATAAWTQRRLSGGRASCPSYEHCTSGPATAVSGLDLGRRSAAFVWDINPGGEGVGATQELRTTPLDGGRSRQAVRAQGYVSGACGYRRPGSPNALDTGGVGFVLTQSPCDADETTIARWAPGAADFEGARPAGTLVGGAAWDGPRIYWLRCAPRHDPEYNADVLSDSCRLVVSRAMPFAPPTLRAHG
jgi:hypothetical protein